MASTTASTTGRTASSASEGICPHCGRPLKPRYVASPFDDRSLFVGYEPCGCPESREASEREAEVAEERRRAEERARERRALERCGIKRRFLDAEHPMADDMALAIEEGKSLYLWGPNGTGKTTLACAVARRFLSSRPVVTTAVNLLIEVQSTYGTPEREADVLARYGGARLLVLDDLGKEQQTAWTASRLYAIVDERYADMMPTVVTSNFPLSELSGRMGDPSTGRAIASRLAGMCEQIHLDGTDRRLADG